METFISFCQIKNKKHQADLPRYYATDSQQKRRKKIVMSRNIVPAFPREDAVASFRLSSAMSSSSFTESIYRSHMGLAHRTPYSILNHNVLPDRSFTLGRLNQLQNCTGTTEGECQSPKCLGIKYYHYKNFSALKIKVHWVMKHQLQVITTGCIIMNT